jgi:hypothetical protein
MTDPLPPVRRVVVDPRRNTLTLVVDERVAGGVWRPAEVLIDVGEGGRLLGVELASSGATDRPAGGPYLALFDVADPLTRSVPATGRIEMDATGQLRGVEIARRGTGYEIAFPSGNQ